MDPTKLKAVEQWEPPKSVKVVRSFIGFCNFYQKFIPHFSAIAWPLIDLTKKGVPFCWKKEQDEAFIKLKETFLSAPVIKMPDMTKPFFVMTDASLTASRGILMQKDSNGDLHPCAYHSATFSPAKLNYDIYDRELLAVIQALKQWCHYLTGTKHPVTVITDHKNLGYFKQPQNLSRWQARWWLFLQEYDIRWGVERGINMGPTDALSRKDEIETSNDNREITLLKGKDQYFHIQAIDTSLAKKISSSTAQDPIITKVLAAMNHDGGEPWIPRTTATDWEFISDSLYFKHCLNVPEPTRHDLVKSLHYSPTGGHKGFFRTLHRMQKDYWWPGMSTFLRKYITGCADCQAAKVNTHPMVPRLSPLAIEHPLPFSSIAVDLITGLPDSHGYDSVMVVVDHGLTKGVIYCPCTKNIDSKGIAQLFFTNVFP